MKLRYTGALPITFIGVGSLDPGSEFEVPDDQAERWSRRSDVEEVPAETPPTKSRKTSDKTAVPADTKESTDGVSDDQ